ncbi:GNAT family protein [Streptomyces sp. NPDC050617]|uniref:GNAT family N-acetyltransferase n=1 Tax=Streptomyces sp. NPDC050617 TaxID=3154628 RepID=UPI00341EBD08
MANTTAAEPLRPADLRGYGLRLRTWEYADAPIALRGFSDPEFLRWNTPLVPVRDEAGARDFIRSRFEGWERGDAATFAITENDEVVGQVALNLIDRTFSNARVGYWVLAEARGRGVAARALELCTRWAFSDVGLNRLELGHALGNVPSCRVAARCGYAFEGTLRGAMFEAGSKDAFRDVHLHARLASDPPPSGFSEPGDGEAANAACQGGEGGEGSEGGEAGTAASLTASAGT